MASDLALAARGLVKRFGRVAAVDGLSLTVRRGDLYGLVGRNGAGKSTTLRLLTGLLRADAGEFVFGEETTRTVAPRHRRRLAALVEAPAFFGRLSGFENLLRLGRLSGPLTADEARRLLAQVGLADDARRPAAEYSLGMKQRLGLALLLAGAPDAILLDEPTNGLDPAGVRDLREILLGLRRDAGATIVVSSHLLVEVERLATRLGVVRDGRMIAEGEPADLIRRDGRLVVEATPRDAARAVLERFGPVAEDGERFVVRPRPDARAADVARALVGAGVALVALGPDPRALEALVLGAEEPAS